MKKEIERKILLKRLPIIPANSILEIQEIVQYYYLVGTIWFRIRKIVSSVFGLSYLHTIKTYKDGITYEEEQFYSDEEYHDLIRKIHNGEYASSFISKKRYVVGTGIDADFDGEIKGIKWEIDVFDKINLVVAEIELPDLKYKIEIPDYLKSEIIYEVTGIKEFSNRNLSEPVVVNSPVGICSTQ